MEYQYLVNWSKTTQTFNDLQIYLEEKYALESVKCVFFFDGPLHEAKKATRLARIGTRMTKTNKKVIYS